MNAKSYAKAYPISAGQIKTIKLGCRQLGITRDQEHDMLEDRYKVRSCTKLNFSQAGHFIKELEAKGFELKPGSGIRDQESGKPVKQALPRPAFVKASASRPAIPRAKGNVIALASRDEIDKLNAIAAIITWRVENGLDLFLERRMGIKGGKVRTSQEAYLAIEGLKKMFENGMKAQHGPNWWVMPFLNKGIMEYISIHKPAEFR